VTSPSDSNRPDVATDLVEYMVVLVPGTDALAAIGAELVEAVASSAIRILDLVVVTLDDQGQLELADADTIRELDPVREVTASWGIILSRHDLELVALALEPGSCAVVLVAEDRWAEPLASVVRTFGGEVRAGERIARERVEAAFARKDRREEPHR
jgi:hypothetical protein